MKGRFTVSTKVGATVFKEILGGDTNGSNHDFTLANIPEPGTETICVGNLILIPTIDYTIVDAAIYIIKAPIKNSVVWSPSYIKKYTL